MAAEFEGKLIQVPLSKIEDKYIIDRLVCFGGNNLKRLHSQNGTNSYITDEGNVFSTQVDHYFTVPLVEKDGKYYNIVDRECPKIVDALYKGIVSDCIFKIDVRGFAYDIVTSNFISSAKWDEIFFKTKGMDIVEFRDYLKKNYMYPKEIQDVKVS